MGSLVEQLGAALGAQYRIDRELGGGGMSRVFLARDVSLDRPVVIKVHPHGDHGVAGDRFRREVQVAAQLQHPNLVPVLSAGDADGLLYFIMPFVEGESLRTRLGRGGPLPPALARTVLRDVARALDFAHRKGIVHRDIKPDNVLLAGDAAMVTDFGVAKALSSARSSGDPGLTGVGMSLGTPSYIAPEQAAGDEGVDHRADLYAWGCVAYEVLTGSPPFTDRTAQQLIMAHITEPVPPLGPRAPEASPRLVALVMECLEKDPRRRPQSAAALVAVLEAADQSEQPARTGGRRIRFAAAIAGVAIAIVAGALLWRGRPVAAGPGGGTSIAVLPLVAVGSPEDEYFADGMTEELIGALSRVPGLRVASRTSVFALKGSADRDVRAIARRLAVTAVLEGSVRRAGGQLRLNAQLTSAADGLTLWSETYQREVSDLFQVQDELAQAIAAALEQRFDPATVDHRGTADLEAYDLYLKGRHRWRQRSDPALREAIGFFEAAIARDPRFARAWAGLGDGLSLLPLYGATAPDSVAGPARAAAERALALDSGLAAAHTTLGNLAKTNGDWGEARAAFGRAVRLDSADLNALQWLGEVEYVTGRLDASVTAFERALAIDSANPIVLAQLGHVQGLRGDDSAARRAIQRAIRLAPNLGPVHLFGGSVDLSAGRPAEAARAFARVTDLSPEFPLGPALECYALALARLERAAAVCASVSTGPGSLPTMRALVALSRGDRAAALAEVEQSFAVRDPFLFAASLNAPWWRTIRDEPRFRAVAAVMGVTLAGG